jgi:hypothetical protein
MIMMPYRSPRSSPRLTGLGRLLAPHKVTYAAIEAELRRTDPGALAAEITASFARLPAGDFPLITAHTAQLVAGDPGERFRFAIDVVIDGVLGRASRR